MLVMAFQPPAEIIAEIKRLYRAYRHTADIDRKGLFFSPKCMQICRPTPSYSATTRRQIIQYLKDAQHGKVPVEEVTGNAVAKGRGVYTIRPLRDSEFDFGTDSIVSPISLSTNQLKQMAEKEKWVGMRVNLWDEGGAKPSLLVKVQYWWRKEHIVESERLQGEESGFGWRQCLHDIMYLGPKDGTEGEHGLDIME